MSEEVISCCTGKEKFERPADAHKAARNMSRLGKTVTAYDCPACDGWHIGRHYHQARRPPHKLRSNGAPRQKRTRFIEEMEA